MLRRAFVALIPLAALPLTALSSAAGHAARPRPGAPWISIEYPANPFDRGTRGAYLLVHAFHHGTPSALPVSGTAEGIVRGRRRSVRLEFEATARTGVHALRRQWDDEGTWTLVVRVTQQETAVAAALVELAATGEVARVQVPTRREREGEFPRAVTAAEVEAGLRARVGTVSLR